MKRYSEHERKDIEKTILALVRDFNHQGMLDLLIKHGIDSPKYFHNADNRRIFEIYLRMNKLNIPIMPESFVKYLNENYDSTFETKKRIIGKFLLDQANPQSYLSSHNAEFFIWSFKEHILQDYWNHIFSMNENNTWKSNDLIKNSFYIVDNFNKLWDKLAKKFEQNQESNLKQKIRDKVMKLREGISTSCKTGLSEFDNFTGGFENSELYLIAARPSIGKTTFALALAKRMIALGKRVHFFTLEMTREQLINRFIADDLQIDYKNIKKGFLSDPQLLEVERLYDIYDTHEYLIIDQPESNTLTEVVNRCKEVEADIRFFDYLQLLNNEEGTKVKLGNREQEVGFISKTLKALAKQLDNPVVALAQLSRSVEYRPDKRPILADLRESGSLEQDADVIIFLFRYAYYMKQKGQIVNSYEEGNMDLIFAKGREIGTGDLKVHLDLANTRVEQGYRYSN